MQFFFVVSASSLRHHLLLYFTSVHTKCGSLYFDDGTFTVLLYYYTSCSRRHTKSDGRCQNTSVLYLCFRDLQPTGKIRIVGRGTTCWAERWTEHSREPRRAKSLKKNKLMSNPDGQNAVVRVFSFFRRRTNIPFTQQAAPKIRTSSTRSDELSWAELEYLCLYQAPWGDT